MLTIAISHNLAADHTAFMAAIAESGHTVDVFDAPGRIDKTRASSTEDDAATLDSRQGERRLALRARMPTLVRDPQPVEFEALLERRRQLGQDLLDEVWEGVYHVIPVPHSSHASIVQQLAEVLAAPARDAALMPMISIFNLGEPGDYRVPDGGLFRPGPDEVFMATAALVVEIVSPGDMTWEKLGFYAAHHVDELMIVDPQDRRVDWLALTPDGQYRDADRSALIELGPAELAARIDWPQ